jgi:hypothetical protein
MSSNEVNPGKELVALEEAAAALRKIKETEGRVRWAMWNADQQRKKGRHQFTEEQKLQFEKMYVQHLLAQTFLPFKVGPAWRRLNGMDTEYFWGDQCPSPAM